MPVDQHEMAMLRAEAEHEQAMARSREITDEMSRCYWDVIDECAGSLRPVGHHVSAWMRAALEAALGQEKHE